MEGKITKIYYDGEGEWLRVKYAKGVKFNTKVKDIGRFNNRITND